MRRFLLLTTIVLLAAVPARAGEPRDLDAALKEKAKTILDHARDKKATNIAVLKFLVRTGDGPYSHNAGPLNNGLADRLTVALILALPNDDIGIIGNAEAVLAESKANPLDEVGRAACFRDGPYFLAWGDPEIKVSPDLFITGTATLSDDLKQTTVRFQAFGKNGKLNELGEIIVPTTTRMLIDTGHSYLMTPKSHPKLFEGARGRPDADLDKDATDVSQKYKADSSNQELPSFEREAPVRVTVLYNGKPVAIDKNGNIPEPKEEVNVSFKLQNLSDDVHGVVLKVNGENTIFREKFDDKDCKKWLLAPRGKQIGNMRDTVLVRGFQEDDNSSKDFKVQPDDVSKANEFRYGPLVGTFQVTVFHAKSDKPEQEPPPAPPPPPPVLKEEQQQIAAISRGVLRSGVDLPGDLAALQAALRTWESKSRADNARGLIGSAENAKANVVEKLPFVPDPPIPVMSYRIRYYQPAGNGK